MEVGSEVVTEAGVEAEGVSGEVEEEEGEAMTRVPQRGLCLLAPSPTPAKRTWWSSQAFRTSLTSMPPFTSRTSLRFVMYKTSTRE